jgi:hypothetical protein
MSACLATTVWPQTSPARKFAKNVCFMGWTLAFSSSIWVIMDDYYDDKPKNKHFSLTVTCEVAYSIGVAWGSRA